MAELGERTFRRLQAADPGLSSRGSAWPAQMAFRMLHLRNLHVALLLHTERDPSAAEWSRGCQAFGALRKQCGDNTASLRTLVISDGGAPNAKQRAEFFQAGLEGLHRTALISLSLSNPVKRGIATALSWVNPRVRAFEPPCWSEAFGYAGLSRHFDAVWSELAKLQQRLPDNQTLRLIATAARHPAAAQRVSSA